MSHIEYNHLYYFWHVYKEGSVVGAAEAFLLFNTTNHYRADPGAGRAPARETI